MMTGEREELCYQTVPYHYTKRGKKLIFFYFSFLLLFYLAPPNDLRTRSDLPIL